MAAEQGAIKKKAAARSWILFDSRGEGTILDVDKYAIMHRVEIHARDLRILDPLLSYPSTILGRERAIVLNLEHIKAIITAEEVLLRDPTDENVVPVVEELKRRLPPSSAQNDVDAPEEDESPFEFRALEVALEAICSFLDARTTELETAAYPALDELTSKISSRNLDRVRKLKSAMTRLNARVQKVRDELEQLLDDDDDMADLYLSRKMVSSPVTGSAGPAWLPTSNISVASRISRLSRASAATVHGNNENDVEELEMLLESGDPERDGNVGSEPRLPGLADLYLSRKMVSSPITGSAGPTSNISVASRISRLSRASAATVHGNENDAEELEMLLEDFTIEQGQRGNRAHRNENDVEELEVLLEAYFMQIDGTLNKLTTLREYIDDTEDYINIQLDNHRNQLIQLELFLSSGTVCLSLYSLVAGIFGMNIPYSWNSGHGYLYKWVVMISGFICIFVFVAIVAYARHKGLVGS